MKITRYIAIGAAVLSAFGFWANVNTASAAYSCSNATYGSSYSNCVGGNSASANSAVVTSAAVLSAASTQTASIISNRVAGALSGGSFGAGENGFSFATDTGASGGDKGHSPIAAWVSGSWTKASDDNAATAFDGHVYTGLVGADYKLTDKVAVGLSAGYERIDIDTEYNGFGGRDGSLKSDGWTVAPYVAVDLGPVVANLSAGYTDVSYDTVRFDPNTGNRITGSPDAQRYFVNAGVGGSNYLADRVRLRSDASVFYVEEQRDSYTETESNGATINHGDDDSHLGRAAIDFRLGYQFEQVEPYALVGVDYDFSKTETPLAAGQTQSGLEDDFGAKFGAGLDLNLGHNVTGGIEAYTSEFRSDYNEYNAMATLRVKF